jgi:small subunit ribosomal protein S5
MAAATARSRAAAAWARLLSLRSHHQHAVSATLPLRHHHHRRHLGSRIAPPSHRHLSFSASGGDTEPEIRFDRVVYELLAEVERERQRERQDRRDRGQGKPEEEDDDEEEEDYMGVKPLIEKLERRKARESAADDEGYWEPTDSDTDEDDERYTPDAIERRVEEFERKSERHGELLQSFAEAGNHPTPPTISTTAPALA